MNFNESESKLEWNQIETKWKSKWNEQKLFETDPDDNIIKIFHYRCFSISKFSSAYRTWQNIHTS
jgi:leucyl-tRNA synthetase